MYRQNENDIIRDRVEKTTCIEQFRFIDTRSMNRTIPNLGSRGTLHDFHYACADVEACHNGDEGDNDAVEWTPSYGGEDSSVEE